MNDFIKDLQAEVLEEKVLMGGNLVYRFLKSNCTTEYGTREVFGIQVTSRIYGDSESAVLLDISTDRDYVEKLYRITADYNVLPSTLKDVVVDYMEEVVPAIG